MGKLNDLQNTSDRYGDTILHKSYLQSARIREIFKDFTQNECVQALSLENNRKNTIIHLSATYPKALKACLEHLETDICYELLSRKNSKGNTPFHMAVHHDKSFIYMVSKVEGEIKRLDILTLVNHFDSTIFWRLLESPKSFAGFLSLVPGQKNTIIDMALSVMGNANLRPIENPAIAPQSMAMLLSCCNSEAHLIETLQTKVDGKPLLAFVLKNHKQFFSTDPSMVNKPKFWFDFEKSIKSILKNNASSNKKFHLFSDKNNSAYREMLKKIEEIQVSQESSAEKNVDSSYSQRVF